MIFAEASQIQCEVAGSPTGRFFALLRMTGWILALAWASAALGVERAPDKTVVLTFDDAVKSQVTNVAPLLTEYGFSATFFITQRWMDDQVRFMSWEDAAALHGMGFEIGNHTWTHDDFGKAEAGARLGAELVRVERELARVGVPRPVSFAWPGNSLGPEALAALRGAGYRFARRGMQPEVKYGEIVPGPLYEPGKHDPLLIPTSGDGYPGWTLEHFKRVVDRARDGKIVVLQFHGVPDEAHPWVTTPLERFREYMAYLNQEGFRCVALREVEPYIDRAHAPDDPLAETLSRPRETASVGPAVDKNEVLFIKAVVDKVIVNEGEPVMLELQLWRIIHKDIASGPFRGSGIKLPPTEGFRVEDLEPTQFEAKQGQQRYQVSVNRKRLYPTRTGVLRIGSWHWEGIALFANAATIGRKKVRYQLDAEPIEIRVVPASMPKP